MKRSSGGYVLLEVLFAIQIIALMVLFVVSVTVYHRSVLIANQQQQSAVFTLQTEMERFVSEKVIVIRAEGQGPFEERIFDVIDEEGYDIHICLSWKPSPSNPMYFLVSGQARWSVGEREKSVTYVTGQFIPQISGEDVRKVE